MNLNLRLLKMGMTPVITHEHARLKLQQELGGIPLQKFDFSQGTSDDKVVAVSAQSLLLDDAIILGRREPCNDAIKFKDVRLNESFYVRFNPEQLGDKIVFWARA